MNVEDTINNIITLENKIAILYSNLYETELSGNKEGCMYSHYINELKDALKTEKELFNSYDVESLNSIESYFESNYQKVESRLTPNNFNRLTIPRIIDNLKCQSINKIINVVESSRQFDALIKKNKIIDIIFSEYTDINMSFLDDYIESCDDIRIKNLLVLDKYITSYEIGNIDGIEGKIVDRYFYTEKSLYLSSLLEASIEKVDMASFLREKNERGLLLIEKYITELAKRNDIYVKKDKSYFEEVQMIRILINIRASFLLLDEDIFKEQINYINSNMKTKEGLQIAFGENILDILIKDRERHKRLSLVRRK